MAKEGTDGKQNWVDLGTTRDLARREVQQLVVGRTRIALICRDGVFSALSGVCNHVGGPLGEGQLEGDYLVCPWHYWKFHWQSGQGEPGYEADRLPMYPLRVERGRVLVDVGSASKRRRAKHPPHPLARPVVREPGPVRVVGISTSMMNLAHPRYSTSEALLESSLAWAEEAGCGTRLIRLRDLKFRPCEGYYSKSAHACTWPCSITQMDPSDELDAVYEAIVHWADAMIIATPIRWGNASGLYYKMVERMNCIQNQETIANRHLLKNKASAFIITGGQDNVQAVAGQMLGFFAELGCQFPQFPFIAHSRGWSAEDMENNVRYVAQSATLHEGARELAHRVTEMARLLVAGEVAETKLTRGGRKGHQLDVKAQI